MKKVIVLGAGNIGVLISKLLLDTKNYQITLLDKTLNSQQLKQLHNKVELMQKDIEDTQSLLSVLQENKFDAVVSALPYFLNIGVAKAAKQFGLHYFDLTEDVSVTEAVREIGADATTAFIPQCGLAPGFVGIAAHSMAKHFDKIDTIKLRVGALPIAPSNVLKYALTWSTDGVINEYGNACLAIINGRKMELQPLEGLETISIDGDSYECFNTSGGLGTLVETYDGRLNNLTYKTIRYPSHCRIMNLLMNDLKLNNKRDILKVVMEHAIPRTKQDVVLIYVTVIGTKNEQYIEENYVKKVYGKTVDNVHYNAIQTTTASSLCAVIDRVLSHPQNYHGFVKQEDFTLDDILSSPFGYCYE